MLKMAHINIIQNKWEMLKKFEIINASYDLNQSFLYNCVVTSFHKKLK
jgi:hypothetical protein